MRHEDGVPREISDLDPEPFKNSPYGSERDPLAAMGAHIRALSAFIAQLQAQIEELKRGGTGTS